MVLHTETHESQMCTPAGPAIILRTSFCAFPQKEQKVIRVDLAIVERVKLGVLELLSLFPCRLWFDHLVNDTIS